MGVARRAFNRSIVPEAVGGHFFEASRHAYDRLRDYGHENRSLGWNGRESLGICRLDRLSLPSLNNLGFTYDPAGNMSLGRRSVKAIADAFAALSTSL